MNLAGYFKTAFLQACGGDGQPAMIELDLFRPVLLGKDIRFSNPEFADAEGLVAVGGDLKMERLLAAYRQGIFPWTVNPITWWSPDPRGIIKLDHFHVSESLARVIRKRTFEVTIDEAFREVMQACATRTVAPFRSAQSPHPRRLREVVSAASDLTVASRVGADRLATTPNPMLATVHSRMPVILSPEHYQWWLEQKRFEPEFLKTLLRPYPAEDMECQLVSKLVNNAKNDSPECLTPS